MTYPPTEQEQANRLTHVILTPKECSCGGDTGRCNVCDGGLGICKHCGAVEAELWEYPCSGSSAPSVTQR